jgi:hypothetical protein
MLRHRCADNAVELKTFSTCVMRISHFYVPNRFGSNVPLPKKLSPKRETASSLLIHRAYSPDCIGPLRKSDQRWPFVVAWSTFSWFCPPLGTRRIGAISPHRHYILAKRLEGCLFPIARFVRRRGVTLSLRTIVKPFHSEIRSRRTSTDGRSVGRFAGKDSTRNRIDCSPTSKAPGISTGVVSPEAVRSLIAWQHSMIRAGNAS